MVDPAKGLSEFARVLLVPDRSPQKGLDDPLQNYIALGLLIFVVIVNFYGIITIIRKLIRWSARFGRVDGPSSGASGKRFRD